MAVYFKFKSAKNYDSIPIDGHFISISTLKEKIFESKHLGRGTDFDLVVTNAQTNEEYLDEDTLIPKNTSVLICRVPGRPCMPIVTEPLNANNQSDGIQTSKSSFLAVDSSTAGYPENEGGDGDGFGIDLYTIPEPHATRLSNPVHDNTIAISKEDEDRKIKALINTPALNWQHQASYGYGISRGFGRGSGRMMGGRGFGRAFGVLDRNTPPPGYLCHRCKVSGHFIQHCPTNGDPNYDIKRVKPPTGIPRSMLMATPDGSYSLASGESAVLKPNEASFEREMLRLPSTHLVGDLPPELRCPLCTEVMKDAVLTSKCCFRSFCDKCIRDYFISKKMCLCEAKHILADDLLPNKTVRDTINRIMKSCNSSRENISGTFQVQNIASKFPEPNLKDKTPSSLTVSAISKGKEVVLPPQDDEVLKVNDSSSDRMLEKSGTGKVTDVKEPASQVSAPLMNEDLQQKPIISDTGKKKKKKKKTHPPMSAEEMQRKMSQDLAAENYMMPMDGPAAYYPYWNGMQPGMEAYGAPYYPVSHPYMGYGFAGPLDPFGGVQQGYMMPPIHPPQRDLAEMGMGFSIGHHPHQPPIMSREEFEARKVDLRMKREFESPKPKIAAAPAMSPPRKSSDRDCKQHNRYGSSNRHREHHNRHGSSSRHHKAEWSKSNLKPSVFSRISYSGGEKDAASVKAGVSKKRKAPSSGSDSPMHHHKASKNGHHHKDYKISSSSKAVAAASVTRKNDATTDCESESSNDDRHFKRKTSRRTRYHEREGERDGGGKHG